MDDYGKLIKKLRETKYNSTTLYHVMVNYCRDAANALETATTKFAEKDREIEALTAENAKLREAQRWITVNERLPEDEDTVEAYTESFGAFDAWYESEGHQWYTRGHEIKKVTHWRIPQPPQKDR